MSVSKAPTDKSRRVRSHLGFASAMFGVGMCLLLPPLLGAQTDVQTEQDPPNRVARVAFTHGNVSLEPAGVDTFSQAELNYPLSVGDRIYADNEALAELETGGLAIRLGNGADLTLTSLTDAVAQLGLAQGSLRLRTRNLDSDDSQSATVEIDTPNGTILVQRPGSIRVDSFPQDDTTVVTVSSGLVEVSGPGFDQQIGANQSFRLAGNNPVYTEYLRPLPADYLDQFAEQRERRGHRSDADRGQYVSPEMIGAAELEDYGDWNPNPDYGQVWYPRAVAADWAPYRNGHWAWIAPWGWTWVEAEPWGFAPFHYGRWANFDGRWGWIPGPPPAVFGGRPPRPVYCPALVAFVGGPRLSVSIGFGGGPGGGVTAWFPLGPREAYVPWYHTTPAYVNRVNVTNIYNRNVTEVHNTYINRTTNVYNTTNITNVTYVNRAVATTVIPQRDFAAGRRVADAQPVRLDGNARRQLDQAPLLPHPLVTPAPPSAAPHAVAGALPPVLARPVLETRQALPPAGPAAREFPGKGTPGNMNAVHPPMAQPLPANGAPAGRTNPAGTPAGKEPAGNPGRPPAQPGRGAFPQVRDRQPLPSQQQPPQQQQQVQGNPVQQRPVQDLSRSTAPGAPMPGQVPTSLQPPPQRSSDAASSRPQPSQAQPHAGVVSPGEGGVLPSRPPARPADATRPLINRAEPQAVQPPFRDQQRAIQRADPGRPLAPQQVDNLRQGRPAGPAGQPESIPHPAAASPHPSPASPQTAPARQEAPQRPAPPPAPRSQENVSRPGNKPN